MATLPFSFRMAGSNPSVLVEDSKLEYQLDPYSMNDAATFVVRHACNVFFRVDALPELLGGGVTLATAIPGCFGASVEAMRFTSEGGVRVPGVFDAAIYSNLAPSYESSTDLRPPSAHALNDAYFRLSNLITTAISDAASAPGTLLAADAAGSVPSALGPNGVVAGPVVCSDLHVVDGGRVVATHYANLPTDFANASTVLPPSAYALRSAVFAMSNWIADSAPSWWRHVDGAAPGGAPFATDAPLLSVDGQPRLQFATNGSTLMSAYQAAPSAPLFAWANRAGGGRAMTLTGAGDLHLAGGLYWSGGATTALQAVTSDPLSADSNVAASSALLAVNALLTASAAAAAQWASNAAAASSPAAFASVGTAAAPLAGGLVEIDVAASTGAVIELGSGSEPLALSLLPSTLSPSSAGAAGSVYIVERSPTGRALSLDPRLALAAPVPSTTTPPPAGSSFSLDVLSYRVLRPDLVFATYTNLYAAPPP